MVVINIGGQPAASAASDGGKLIFGVCAMRKKTESKSMRTILSKMKELFGRFISIKVFDEQMILKSPVEEWPVCDALIAFFSDKFPLHKAVEYWKLRCPFLVNDLEKQYYLFNRAKVYSVCQQAGVPVPNYVPVYRQSSVIPRGKEHSEILKWRCGKKDGSKGIATIQENNDNIIINGQTVQKPFVEKPIDADDHNVCIYFHSSSGGGSQRLFRKVGNQSSEYSSECDIRKNQSYIYEQFLPAEGIDIKVYTVGPDYAHAEARKAPGLDGVVERDEHGKEVRFPVLLTTQEKQYARALCLAFGQSVNGFDLLRANGCSYVCDVNGFSFVKSSSTKYYEECAVVLGNMIIRALLPLHPPSAIVPMPTDKVSGTSFETQASLESQYTLQNCKTNENGADLELRCVLGVLRHGDRTPKQKLKILVDDKKLFELFVEEEGLKKGHIKMKRPKQLSRVLAIARQNKMSCNAQKEKLMVKMHENEDPKNLAQLQRELRSLDRRVTQWDNVRAVLETKGHFSGINRKVQLKSNFSTRKTSDLESSSSLLLLIVKWGGELTQGGIMQAEALGRLFRTLYPAFGDGEGSDDSLGLGFLRLHSTFRHDLKIYASDEGRVQMTAAAFARGLLALDGELPPILAQMVKSANTDGLLDDENEAEFYEQDVRTFLHNFLQQDRQLGLDDMQLVNPQNTKAIKEGLEFIGNPRKMCAEIYTYVQQLVNVVEFNSHMKHEGTLYQSETWALAGQRWYKLMTDFYCDTGTDADNNSAEQQVRYDISKIPDFYDNLKYDMEHNPDLCLRDQEQFERFYYCVKAMADVLVPMEYGICANCKVAIAQGVCTPLLRKLRQDLHVLVEGNEEEQTPNAVRLNPKEAQGIATPSRHVRSRLYFTSESHLHTIMNVLQYGGLAIHDRKWKRATEFLQRISELNYMTQIVIMLYEDRSQQVDSDNRFHISLHFSPGLYPCLNATRERMYMRSVSRQTSARYSQPMSASLMGSMKEVPEESSAVSDFYKGLMDKDKNENDIIDEDDDEYKDLDKDVTLVTLDDSNSPQLVKKALRGSISGGAEDSSGESAPNSRKVSLFDRGASSTQLQRATSVTPRISSTGDLERMKTAEVPMHWPYQYRMHAVNLLTDVVDKFINRTLMDDTNNNLIGPDSGPRMLIDGASPAIMNTAVIGRSCSEPRLLSDATEIDHKMPAITEIRRFWPPLRSLETLHDEIPFGIFEQLLDDVIKIKNKRCMCTLDKDTHVTAADSK